jgi:hypothetical protein
MEEGLMALTIDPEFQALIPALTEDERAQLEGNLLEEGCRDPLVVWQGEPPVDVTHRCQVPWVYQPPLETMLEQGSWLCPACGETRQQPYVLLDGHHRYELCQTHGLPFTIMQAPAWVKTREDALVWIIQNQLGRRNLRLFQRIELAGRLRPLLEKKAHDHQGARTDLRPNLAGSRDTKQAIADQAGVARETVRKAEVIMQEADEPTKEALRRGERSIHGVYKQLRPRQATSNGQPAPMTPEPEEHIHTTDRLSELITAMIELTETLRGELAAQRAQFPQATWGTAYDKMQHDLGKMQEFLQALSRRAREAQDRRMAERAGSVEVSAAGTTGP